MTLNNKLRGASSYSEAFSIVKKIIDDSEQFPRGCVVYIFYYKIPLFIKGPCCKHKQKLFMSKVASCTTF